MKGSRKKSAKRGADLDNIPLKCVSKSRKLIEELRRYSVQACEFCERTFENRYDTLVHNSKHIIIPLIKQIPQHCPKCDLYCISEDHLQDHISIKHRDFKCDTNVSENKTSNKTMFETDVSPEEFGSDDIVKDEALDQLVEIERFDMDIGMSNEKILKNFMMNCKVDIEKFEPLWSDRGKGIPYGAVEVKKDIVTKLEPSSDISESDNPVSIQNESYMYKYDSIHFDDLKKPGIFHCKHCSKRFPNRYEVIIHELVHLDLSKVITIQRKRTKHKRATSATKSTKASRKSYETVRYHQDASNKESVYKHHCSICAMGCPSYFLRLAHEKKCVSMGTKTMQMCDGCALCVRMKKMVDYTPVGKLCNLAIKTECHRCGKLFHEVTLLRLTHKRTRMVNRIRFESNKIESKATHQPLPLTNRARLKNIQNRLKLINKYNALYFMVLFDVSSSS